MRRSPYPGDVMEALYAHGELTLSEYARCFDDVEFAKEFLSGQLRSGHVVLRRDETGLKGYEVDALLREHDGCSLFGIPSIEIAITDAGVDYYEHGERSA